MERQDCEKVYSCDDCGKRSKFSLENHKNYCPAMSYVCIICHKSFKNRNLLEHHQIHHANKREFGCDDCGKRFNVNSDLKVHQRIHTGEKNFYCNDCGKSFLGSSQLRSHKNVHSEAKDFLCDCGKGFKTTDALKRHAIVHKDVKDFECYVCEKSFKGDFHLRDHMQLHNNVSFSCKACGNFFKKKAYLTSHMQKRHTKESDKPYQCSFCGKAFVVKSHRNAHTKKQHPETIIENWRIEVNDDLQREEATLACVLCNKTMVTLGDLDEHLKSNHLVSTNSSFLTMASKLYTFEPSNVNVVTLIMDEILQEGQKGAIISGQKSDKGQKKRKPEDEEQIELLAEKEVKAESFLLQDEEAKRKENITARVKTRGSVASTYFDSNKKAKHLNHEKASLSKKDRKEDVENKAIQGGIGLIVDVKVEDVEGDLEKEEKGSGIQTTFEKQKGKTRKHVFGKRSRGESLAMPSNAGETLARVDLGGARVEENNEWNEALDSTYSSQDPSSIGGDEKILKRLHPMSRIPDQLLYDFQELCCPDIKSS